MKKLKVLLIILSLILMTGCKSDSVIFKEEYESLNNESNYREVLIDSDNKIVYITDEELEKKIENKEDMVVYFGFAKCPWCRSVIETLIEVSKDLDIDKIYYLDVSKIRDVKKLDEGGNIIIEKEGSKSYNKIVDLLSEYLSDYVINDKVVGKRIYAPNILVIKNKSIQGITTGISPLQTDPNQKLTDEIKSESYALIFDLLKKYNTNVCSSTKGC